MLADLPRGVAVVRIVSGERSLLLVSSRLTRDQQVAAKAAAALLFMYSGVPYVSVSCAELLALMQLAA